MATAVDPGVKKGGGGLLGELGSALGAIAGAISVPLTGGASLPLVGAALGATGSALAGAAAGNALGGTVGGLADKAIDPRTEDSRNQGPAISRRAASLDTQDPEATLKNSIVALDSPDVPPELKRQAAPILTQAYGMSRKKVGTTGGIS